eukprot:3551448-Pleurochrysis_carterae.AAC.1
MSAAPALLASLQLLGNPASLLRSLFAGLSDALQLPMRGLQQGPLQFFTGIAAGASSLLLHSSHGIFTSVSDFTSALAHNLVIDAPSPAAHDSVSETAPMGSARGAGGSVDAHSREADYAPLPTSAISAYSTSEAHEEYNTFLAGAEHAAMSSGHFYGLGRQLFMAVAKPVSGALGLVSSASHSLSMLTSFAPPPPSPQPLPPLHAGARAQLSREWIEQHALPTYEIYWAHVHATALWDTNRHDAQVVVLLSLPMLRIITLHTRACIAAIPLHHILRVEVPDVAEVPRAAQTPASSSAEGSSAYSSRFGNLSVFVCRSEGERLSLPGCLHFESASANRFLVMYEHLQLVLARSIRFEAGCREAVLNGVAACHYVPKLLIVKILLQATAPAFPRHDLVFSGATECSPSLGTAVRLYNYAVLTLLPFRLCANLSRLAYCSVVCKSQTIDDCAVPDHLLLRFYPR